MSELYHQHLTKPRKKYTLLGPQIRGPFSLGREKMLATILIGYILYIALVLISMVVCSRINFRRFRDLGRFQYLKKGKPGGRQILCLAGYGMPTETWNWLGDYGPFKHSPDEIIVLKRRLYEEEQPLWVRLLLPPSWLSLWWQRRETENLVRHALKTGLLRPGFLLVGHSIGKTIAGHLAECFPKEAGKSVMMAGATDKFAPLLTRGTFWAGVIYSLPLAVLMTILPWWGFKPVYPTARALFSGRRTLEETVQNLMRKLVPESPLAFYALVFWYRGHEFFRARQKGYDKTVVHIVCPHDPIFRSSEIGSRAHRYDPVQVYQFAQSTPHCPWFESSAHAWGHNSEVLARAFGTNGHDQVGPEHAHLTRLTRQ